mmetsp:Transcript_28129/g.71961  ORF Transcript_28129/g.71961 Transcript_28129/m.71961 type:complete len:208 (-) Transcript_28129:396-1019(-)
MHFIHLFCHHTLYVTRISLRVLNFTFECNRLNHGRFMSLLQILNGLQVAIGTGTFAFQSGHYHHSLPGGPFKIKLMRLFSFFQIGDSHASQPLLVLELDAHCFQVFVHLSSTLVHGFFHLSYSNGMASSLSGSLFRHPRFRVAFLLHACQEIRLDTLTLSLIHNLSNTEIESQRCNGCFVRCVQLFHGSATITQSADLLLCHRTAQT